MKLRLHVLNIGKVLSIEVQVALIDTVLLGLHLVPQVLIIGDSALLLARFDHLFTLPVLQVQFLEYLELLNVLAVFNPSLIPSLLHLFLQLCLEQLCCLRLHHL